MSVDYLRQLMEATLGGDVFTSVDYICQYNEALSAEKICFCGLPPSVDRNDVGGE